MIKLVNERLDCFEQRLSERDLGARRRIPDRFGYRDIGLSEETPPNSQSHVAPISTPLRPDGQVMDLQGDFKSLKDSLARIKLPAELKLNESRQGIRRSDQPALNIVQPLQ